MAMDSHTAGARTASARGTVCNERCDGMTGMGAVRGIASAMSMTDQCSPRGGVAGSAGYAPIEGGHGGDLFGSTPPGGDPFSGLQAESSTATYARRSSAPTTRAAR